MSQVPVDMVGARMRRSLACSLWLLLAVFPVSAQAALCELIDDALVTPSTYPTWSVGDNALYARVTRIGGIGSYGNILSQYLVTAALPSDQLDTGLTSWVTATNLQGGSVFGGWFGSNTPMAGQVWMAGAAIGTEINVGNRWGDLGLQTDIGWTRYTVGLQLVPDVLPSADAAPPAEIYPGTFAQVIAASIHGHRWWTGTFVRTDAIMPGGYANLAHGGSDSDHAPLAHTKVSGNWTTGLDLSGAIFADAAIRLPPPRGSSSRMLCITPDGAVFVGGKKGC